MSRTTPAAPPPTTASRAPTIPVCFSSSVTVNQLAAPTSPNVAQINNPYRIPVFIDEVRFQIITQNVTTAFAGGALRVGFSVGRHTISQQPIPVWLYGTPIQRAREALSEVVGGVNTTVEHYRWKLARPLYLAPGSALVPTYVRTNAAPFDTANAMDVNTTFVGRAIPPGLPMPDARYVPYVATFASTLPALASGIEESNSTHLFNPFIKGLYVQRLTGRLFDPTGTDPFPGPVVGEAVTMSLEPGSGGAVVLATLGDSYGYGITKGNPLPFGEVFDVPRRAMTFHHILQAKEYYKILLTGIPAGIQAQIALVGYREEETLVTVPSVR